MISWNPAWNGAKCTKPGLADPDDLARTLEWARNECPQSPLARHRTGWTARIELAKAGPCCLKVYTYPGLEPLRGPFRTTFLCPSRAAREARILAWLRAKQLGAPAALAWGEERFLGWLRRAWLLTTYREALDAAKIIAQGKAQGLAAALGIWLARAHQLGLEDRNPHLRNFLVNREDNGGWKIEKIDSPKARIHSGPPPIRARKRDLEIIEQDGKAVGLDWPDFISAYTVEGDFDLCR